VPETAVHENCQAGFGEYEVGFARKGPSGRQPVMRALRNRRMRASSVSLLPLDRIRDMTSERLRMENTSGMRKRLSVCRDYFAVVHPLQIFGTVVAGCFEQIRL
jgi:hypothetical protein